ncbi:MAG: hypothetical protein GY847_13510 [Proteobacteria bacterium]|nr:hypothetical protein [Pseudomonadota bacterium]
MNHESKSFRIFAYFAQFKGTLIVFVLSLAVFGGVSADRLLEHSHDNHYAYLAQSLLNGRLHIDGKPPHRNDWAKYEDKWYVSFPPAPGILMIPGVAVAGLEFNDRVFTLFFAAAGPALLFLLLQMLVKSGRLNRRTWEIGVLAAVYGIGTVYFFSAVQGSVWFTAHMVGGVFLLLFLISGLNGRHPLLAGLFLGLAFASRPPMLLAFPFFIYELLRPGAPDEAMGLGRWIVDSVRRQRVGPLIWRIVLFGLPIAAILATLMLMNWARFDDPFEFGHKYLQVRWHERIARWGLFHYHYLARNLSVSLTLLPWLSIEEPYLGISRHGLAIWFTTPVLFWLLWPQKRTKYYTFLALTFAFVALPSLLYQNSGWIQFGYRFSLDYTVFFILMLAEGGRKFGKIFLALCIFSVAVNLFGAITFDRSMEFYPSVSTKSYFQPD